MCMLQLKSAAVQLQMQSSQGDDQHANKQFSLPVKMEWKRG